ncbi:MAG: hypothetical protein ACK6CT_03185 [Planctomycetia bacterium]
MRAAAVTVALGGLVWLVATKLIGRLAVPLADASLAIAVERSHPGFRDSLSTTIALAGSGRDDVDTRLLARTAAEAAALVDAVDTARIFRRRRLVSLALAAAAAAATVGLLVAARPAIGQTWARRMFGLSAVAWPRRTALDVEGFVAGVRTVARGSDVELVVHARGSSGPPAAVDLRTRSEAGWTSARMGMRGAAEDGVQTFVHVVRSVAGDVPLEIRGGDARLRDLRLHAVDPPAVDAFAIRCLPPAYLGAGLRVLPAARTIPVPAGSRVEITCTATTPLRAARLVCRSSGAAAPHGGTIPAPVAAPESAGESTAETTVATLDPAAAGARAVSGTLVDVRADTAVIVRLVDTDGLANRDTVAFTLVAVADESPRVGLRIVGGPTAVTPRGRIMIEGSISDDHGLTGAAITLRPVAGQLRQGTREAGPRSVGSAGGGADAAPATVPIGRVRGGETVVDIAAADPLPVPLDALRLVVGGRLLVAAEARDGCTLAAVPNIGTSDTWTLDVVTPEALRALLEAREILLRRRFEAAIEDLVRARERLTTPQRGTEAAAADQSGTDPAMAAVTRCGEAATRAAGETGEIAGAFRGIGLELANNLLLSAELESRLVVGITRPLAAIAAVDLPDLAKACRPTPGGPVADPAAIVGRADAVLGRMREVLAKMLEAESVNEVVERLRSMLRRQEQIRAETLETQKRQSREALERP